MKLSSLRLGCGGGGGQGLQEKINEAMEVKEHEKDSMLFHYFHFCCFLCLKLNPG